MKKFLLTLCLLITAFSLVACQQSKEHETADNEFIKVMGENLTKRNEMVTKDVDEAEHQRLLTEAIEMEIEGLEQFQDREFTNPELRKLYDDYIEQLKIQEEMVIFYNEYEISTEMDKFAEAYIERSKIIKTLIEKYGLKLNEELEREFTSNATKVEAQEEVNEKIIESLKNTDFVYESYKLTGHVKNETGKSITNKEINVKVFDDEGVNVANGQYYIDNMWEPDEVRVIDFFLDREPDISSIEFSIIDY